MDQQRYVYSMLGNLMHSKSSKLLAVAVSNFVLPEPQEGQCAIFCSRLKLRRGAYYRIALCDPIVIKAELKYAGSARTDPRSQKVIRRLAFKGSRWCIFETENSQKWLAVDYDYATSADNI